MSRGYARLRERNQLTLPAAIVERMGLSSGDMVEFSVSEKGAIQLRPAKIVTAGTAEAWQEEQAAEEDIRRGRYSVMESVEDFRDHVARVRKGETPAGSQGQSETVNLTEAQRLDVEAVVETKLNNLLTNLLKAERGREADGVERRQVRPEAGGSV